MNIVIVGAGQAGAWVARSLRDAGFAGSVTLVGSETHLPYERPPLSKRGLSIGEPAFDLVFTREDYTNLRIDLVLGTSVISVDRDNRSILCSDGKYLVYDRLVLTTGGRARRPLFTGNDHPGVFTLRTIEDAAAISERLHVGRHMVVAGGGWLGLEVAASARARGLEVTVIEGAGRLCARSLPESLSTFLLNKHLSHGVDVKLGTSLTRLDLENERLVGTTGGDSQELRPADLVVLGVGLEPNTEIAIKAGLNVDNGIVVDEYGSTSDPHIYAAGDVANLPCSWGGGRMRLESWANAQNHGIAVGRSVAGEKLAYDELPWFWSDQYDMNLQMAGIFAPGLREVWRGDPVGGSFSLFQVRHDRVVAAASINAPREFRQAKLLIKSMQKVDVTVLADRGSRLDKLPFLNEQPAA
jgi:3-phenylpropionate/trans-cinnamate dioxygenase ferredoxin reductase component